MITQFLLIEENIPRDRAASAPYVAAWTWPAQPSPVHRSLQLKGWEMPLKRTQKVIARPITHVWCDLTIYESYVADAHHTYDIYMPHIGCIRHHIWFIYDSIYSVDESYMAHTYHIWSGWLSYMPHIWRIKDLFSPIYGAYMMWSSHKWCVYGRRIPHMTHIYLIYSVFAPIYDSYIM